MGHDIYARRVDAAEQQRQHEEFERRVNDVGALNDSWLREYDLYCTKVNVAHLRRSAFDENNSLIYQALNCMDLYAGCSGNGEARTFTRKQVEAAYESLAGCARGRETSHADDLVDQLMQKVGADQVEIGGSEDDDRSPEYEFLRTVLAWMDEQKRDTIEIDFS